MRRETTYADDRAVSEALSYVLVFGLITIATAIIYIQGTPALNNAEQQQVNQNAERAVFLVQERIDEMLQQNAPVREVSVDLQDVTVGVGGMEPAWINVTVHHGPNVTSYNSTVDPVYMRTESRTIAYANGAVMIGQQDIDESWGMRRDPSWAVSTNGSDYLSTAFLRTISTRGNGEMGGSGRARLVFESTGRTDEILNDANGLNVTVGSPRSTAWESYFGRLNSSLNASDLTVTSDTVGLEVDEFAGGGGSVSYNEQALRTRVEG